MAEAKTTKTTRSTRTTRKPTANSKPDTTGDTTTFPSSQVPEIPGKTAYGMGVTDITGATEAPYLTLEDYESQLEQVTGRKRGAQLIGQQWQLKGEIIKAQTEQVKAETQGLKYLTAVEGYKQAKHQLNRSEVFTRIAGVDVEMATRDLQGKQTEAQIHSSSWDIKLEGLTDDRDHGRELLNQKRQAQIAQLASARERLQGTQTT